MSFTDKNDGIEITEIFNDSNGQYTSVGSNLISIAKRIADNIYVKCPDEAIAFYEKTGFTLDKYESELNYFSYHKEF